MTALTCALPRERAALFPPPTCTDPIEPFEVLPPAPEMSTGEVEVVAHHTRVLSTSKTPPFPVNEESNVERAYARVSEALSALDLEWELVFSVDPCTDRTEELIRCLLETQ